VVMNIWRKDRFSYTPEEFRQMRISFSENGEDLVVLDILTRISCEDRGVYVDAGAFNPVLMSNTHLLYLNGWRGVNIDASPLNIKAFEQFRQGDSNICCALSSMPAELLFLEYSGGTGSRLVPLDKDGEKSLCGDTVIKSTRVRARPLSEVLQCVLGDNLGIDFLNVDCEGLDWEVLSGLDFSKFRPKVVCVETAWEASGRSQRFSHFFDNLNYCLHAYTPSNSIYVCRDIFDKSS
jgi:FkbM family methyltransferase